MKYIVTLLVLTSSIAGIVSCASNEKFDQGMDGRNDAYPDMNDRLTKRPDARKERTEIWFNRRMQ
jgi:hypothetical protein